MPLVYNEISMFDFKYESLQKQKKKNLLNQCVLYLELYCTYNIYTMYSNTPYKNIK